MSAECRGCHPEPAASHAVVGHGALPHHRLAAMEQSPPIPHRKDRTVPSKVLLSESLKQNPSCSSTLLSAGPSCRQVEKRRRGGTLQPPLRGQPSACALLRGRNCRPQSVVNNQ